MKNINWKNVSQPASEDEAVIGWLLGVIVCGTGYFANLWSVAPFVTAALLPAIITIAVLGVRIFKELTR